MIKTPVSQQEAVTKTLDGFATSICMTIDGGRLWLVQQNGLSISDADKALFGCLVALVEQFEKRIEENDEKQKRH